MIICNHLNYMRSLSPGKAIFYYQTKDREFNPLQVERTSISGQKSGLNEAYDNSMKPLNVGLHALSCANIHTIDCCYVPPGVSELYCRFSLRVEANSLEPNMCSDGAVKKLLSELSHLYRLKGGYQELSRRYCKNILMGRWLWRNKHTRGTRIEVESSSGRKYSIEDSRQLTWHDKWESENKEQLEKLSSELSVALSTPDTYWYADVNAIMQTGFCDEVYPSQAFTEKAGKGECSRQLMTAICNDGSKAACFRSDKVGAAIQMVDDWWSPDADKPLRTHEYGADRASMIAMRHPLRKNDFYQLLTKLEELVEQINGSECQDGSQISGDIHFLMSVLIKGGMFQRGKEK
ncbi:type I-F CRISPR-associated protein Csy3 [Zobellella aerophila]